MTVICNLLSALSHKSLLMMTWISLGDLNRTIIQLIEVSHPLGTTTFKRKLRESLKLNLSKLITLQNKSNRTFISISHHPNHQIWKRRSSQLVQKIKYNFDHATIWNLSFFQKKISHLWRFRPHSKLINWSQHSIRCKRPPKFQLVFHLQKVIKCIISKWSRP